MADFTPNDEQRDFIKSFGKNLLVSASAGSGKTSTMIRKLIKILDDDQPVSSLLVVTYTNAAASEMRLKLYNELNKFIQTVTDDKKKAFLKEQLDNINNAEIGTLHAICKKILVKYFYELGESPDFNLVLDKEQKYLLDMAVNNVFSKHIKDDDNEFFDLYDCYNSSRSDTQLKAIVLQLYNYKLSKTEYNAWKNEFLNSTYSEDLKSNPACIYLLEHYQKQLLQISSQILMLIQEARDCAYDKYIPFLDCRRQFIDEFSVCSDFETSVKILDNILFMDKPRVSKNMSAGELEFDERVAGFRDYFSKVIGEIKDAYTSTDISVIKNNIGLARKNVIKVLSLVDEIEANYSKIKKQKNLLDFNDLEDKMLELLQNEQIRNSLKEQYKFVFVDEYQDINEKQEKILKCLVSDNNYYMIGDVKQSIYAFRQSSPEIFINKYNEFSLPNPNSKVIKFNTNYRSDKNILEFCNNVFDKIITRSTIGIDYESDARFQTKNKFKESNVSIHIIDEKAKAAEQEILEANLVAEEIRRIMTLKKADGTNFDFGDIAVIIKERGNYLNVLCEVLAGFQIPVKASVKTNFFNTSEIQLLIAILEAISNYRNDIALSIVLKNLFDMSEYELMHIRATNKDVLFYEAVENYQEDDEIANKIKKCFEFLAEARNLLSTMTLPDLLYKIVDDFNILLKVKTSRNGIEKANNIEDFIRITDSDNYKYNLDKFLDYLKIVSKEDTAKVVGDSNNAVEICTIHHSKGLEYPAVILSRVGHKFNLSKESGNIIMNNKFGVGLKGIDSISRTLDETVIRSACKLDNKMSQVNEFIRLLYVAMTRAKEKLSIVGTYELDKYVVNKRRGIYYSSSFFDMLFKGVDNCYNSHFLNEKKFVINRDTPSEAVVNIYRADDLIEELPENDNPIILDKSVEELVSSLSNLYNDAPVYSPKTIKNSVTSILKEESDYENLNFSPKKLDATDKVPSVDVLKLGTAYHTVMQNVDFTEDLAKIEKLIAGLVSSGEIDYELSKNIKPQEILKAIEVIAPYLKDASAIYKEKQFLLCENYNKLVDFTDNNTKVIVQGVIDFAIVKGDEVYLIDYKTNRGITAEVLIDEYKLQLSLYQKAFEEATNLKVTHKYLYSFYLGRLIEVI